MALIALFLAALLALPAHAQEAGEFHTACFLGLNDADTAATLGDCEAQAALNVESNLQGTAILKRKGFSKTADLAIATGPVTGSHSFIDSSGNKKDIVCQDRNCSASTNGNAFVVIHSTSAAGITRWSWVDVGGIAYGANNKYEKIIKYDGTSTSSPVGIPLGSILELSQDRLIIGDISGSPNRVHKSSAGAYEQFTVGVNPEDSYFDEIGAPGDKIRGIKCHGGVCDYFKTASITRCEEADQYSTRCSVLSPNLGTTDPASIITAGSNLYFRAQDKNYWEISSQGFRQISQRIPNLVKSQSGGLGGGENSNTQTTQTDWNNGTKSPSNTWDTVTIPGSIFPSSTTFVDLSTASFALGSGVGAGVNPRGNIEFSGVTSTYVFRYDAGVLPSNDGWTTTNTGGATASVAASSLTLSIGVGLSRSLHTKSFTAAGDKSAFMVARAAVVQSGVPSESSNLMLEITDASQIRIASVFITSAAVQYRVGGFPFLLGQENITQNSYSTYTVIVDTPTSAAYFWRNGLFKSSGTFSAIASGPAGAKIDFINESAATTLAATAFIDFLHISSSVPNPGISDIPGISTFTSRIFDTAYTTPTTGPFLSTETVPTNTAITYALRTSTSPNNDMWGAYDAVIPSARPTAYTNRYWQYKLTLAHSSLTESPGITGVNLAVAATGFYTTQCIQPNTSISAWGTLSCAETLAGNGSIVYFATSAATCATLPAVDPGSWQTSITNNATVSIATNTAVKIGWRSLLTSATDQAQIDACTLAWNEGAPVQPSWAVYDSIKNAIYWTATVNGAASANRLLKYDLNLGYWYPFDIPAQAPRMNNNSLYFGGSSSGTWNQFGSVDADAGGAITAFWQSKDVGANNPFLEKDFGTASVLSRNQQAGSMTATYTFSNAESGAYTISLSTGAGINYARSNFNLPKTSPQTFMSLRLGNNNSTPFEILGIGITWAAWPWKVTTE